jgi:hypothetical protein
VTSHVEYTFKTIPIVALNFVLIINGGSQGFNYFRRCVNIYYVTIYLCRNNLTLLDLSQSQSYFMTDSQSVTMSWCRAHYGICDQILLPVGRLLSESCGLVSVGCPL